MVSTAGTIAAAAAALIDAGATPQPIVLATHGLLVGEAVQRLGGLPIQRIIFSDTVERVSSGLPIRTVSVAPLLAEAIKRLNSEQSLADLIVHQ
jgi:ribose-phosphate pyrophosphokinase